MMIRLAAVPFLLLLMALAAPALAQNSEPPIGSILALEGDGDLIMRASEDGKAYPARLNDQIYRNDVVQSGSGTEARILVVMIDESRFTLGANSQFKTDEYAFDDRDERANTARYSITQGTFLYTSGFMARQGNPDIKISTPYGAIGIPGAVTVWGGQLGTQYGVFVDDGEARLESNRGHLMIKAGQGTTLGGLKMIPERPHALEDEIVEAARSVITLHDIDKIKERMEAARKNYPGMIELHKAYTHNARVEQFENSGSVRRQNRGILKIEQDRRDERMRAEGKNEQTEPGTSIMTPAPEVNSKARMVPPQTSEPEIPGIDPGPRPDVRRSPGPPKTVDPL